MLFFKKGCYLGRKQSRQVKFMYTHGEGEGGEVILAEPRVPDVGALATR